MTIALFLAGCKSVEPDDSEFKLNINVALPVSDVSVYNKVMGDPGQTEVFKKPRYGYIYLVNEADGEAEVMTLYKENLDENDWELRTYNGVYMHQDDYVYVYKKTFVILLPSKRDAGRIYIAMSYYPLNNLRVSGHTSDYEPQTEEDVKNLVFDLNANLKSSLQDIYSSPVGYIYNGKYYGTIQNYAYDPSDGTGNKATSIHLPLYHVASKVDVIWNVREDKQQDVRITNVKATHVYDGQCYLFRPTENTVNAATYASGYDVELTNNNIAMQWEGRSYFYAIPYTNNADKCPLQLEFQANENTAGSYKTTVLNEPTSPFVPWIRGKINISRNVEELYN